MKHESTFGDSPFERSALRLSLEEKRLLAIGLNRTDSGPSKSLTLINNTGCSLHVSALEYAEIFNVHSTAAYHQIKAASEKLLERYVRHEVTVLNVPTREGRFRWVSRATYAENEGYVELNFSPEIAPYLERLGKQFTTCQLKHLADFDTAYSRRLFELLKFSQSSGVCTILIEDFWEAMEAPPSCRKDFRALRTRVIEPAVLAISSKAGLLVEWEPLRSGRRRVSGLEFRFAPAPPEPRFHDR